MMLLFSQFPLLIFLLNQPIITLFAITLNPHFFRLILILEILSTSNLILTQLLSTEHNFRTLISIQIYYPTHSDPPLVHRSPRHRKILSNEVTYQVEDLLQFSSFSFFYLFSSFSFSQSFSTQLQLLPLPLLLYPLLLHPPFPLLLNLPFQLFLSQLLIWLLLLTILILLLLIPSFIIHTLFPYPYSHNKLDVDNPFHNLSSAFIFL